MVSTEKTLIWKKSAKLRVVVPSVSYAVVRKIGGAIDVYYFFIL
jgi:hypothetical protein